MELCSGANRRSTVPGVHPPVPVSPNSPRMSTLLLGVDTEFPDQVSGTLTRSNQSKQLTSRFNSAGDTARRRMLGWGGDDL